MFIKDYERELILEKGGILSDSDNEEVRNNSTNFMLEDEKKLKESFKVLYDEKDEDNGDWFRTRQQTKEEEEKKEGDYKLWLIGQEKEIKDKETVSSLKPLKEYWNDVTLAEGEKFLRDYFLKQRYLETEQKNYIPTYDEIVENLSEDENEIEKQEEFEHKYNFRFEDPDQEYIKRYPRTIEGSLRREDNRRKLKRQETKERKAREKEEKMEELRKLRDIKRKEIEEKIEKLKDITGNKEINFTNEDIEGDFDPEAHDKRMQDLFNDDYYTNGPEEDIKPSIDLDDEDALELVPENYDDWTGPNGEEGGDELHCEDDSFNMDADYDPKITQKELVDSSRKKKKRKRKSKFVEMLAKERPKFNPMNKDYEKYVDEYYKYDCEDIIDDIPCKFKYRKVVPNSFGLSVEEILLAKDRELNKWCSLKKAVSLRNEEVEKYEQIIYSRKGENVALKKKIIPSLFEDSENNKKENSQPAEVNEEKHGTIVEQNSEEVVQTESNINYSSKKKKCKKQGVELQSSDTHEDMPNSNSFSTDSANKNEKILSNSSENTEKVSKKKQKRKKPHTDISNNNSAENQEQMFEFQNAGELKIEAKKNQRTKNKRKIEEDTLSPENIEEEVPKKKQKREKSNIIPNESNAENKKQLNETQNVEESKKNQQTEIKKHCSVTKKLNGSDQQKSKKKFKKNKMRNEDTDIGITDARIACYGWNPKKFKNKLIYGNKDQKK